MLTDKIFSLVWDIADWFYWIYAETDDWIYPFSLVAELFYNLYLTTFRLLTPIAQLGDWIDYMSIKIESVLTWESLTSWLLELNSLLEPVVNWYNSASSNIRAVVNSWWAGTSSIVQTWIENARQGIISLISQVEAQIIDLGSTWSDFWTLTWPEIISDLGGLRSAWDEFITTTFPGLATWTGVNNLVESTLRSWLPFYNELVALWGELREFAVDPEAYLVKRLETMIERFW